MHVNSNIYLMYIVCHLRSLSIDHRLGVTGVFRRIDLQEH